MKVLVFGTFDRLHPGHRFVLTEAKKRGELYVVVARDRNVLRIKQKKPMQSERERKNAIAKAFPSAHVILGDPKNFLKPVLDIQPQLILLGYDQLLPPGLTVENLPCAVERLPAFYPDRYKSSKKR